MDTTTKPSKTISKTKDFLPLEGTDYVEFYVGNAKQAAHFYKTAFGFKSLAYAGPETGVRDRASYALRQNAKTGELALACPLCDVEARGGTQDDVMLVAKHITSSAKK